MKGVPEAPQCGFSAMVVRILDEYGTVFHNLERPHFNLEDEV